MQQKVQKKQKNSYDTPKFYITWAYFMSNGRMNCRWMQKSKPVTLSGKTVRVGDLKSSFITNIKIDNIPKTLPRSVSWSVYKMTGHLFNINGH